MTWGQYTFPSFPWWTGTSGWRRATWSTSATAGTQDKTDDLQFAFFNGVGWESWENVWGIWNGITPRDAEATRRVAAIERARGAVPGQPGLGAALSHATTYGVYASRWPLGNETVWTIVNRNRLRHRAASRWQVPVGCRACATSISITAWS